MKINSLLVFVLVGIIQSCQTNKSNNIEIEFYRMYALHKYERVVVFNNDEINIIDWSNQKFEINNKQKIALVDSAYLYGSALNAYLNVKNNGQVMYQVSIVPLACASYYNYKLPYLFMHEKGSVFNNNMLSFNITHPNIDKEILQKVVKFGEVYHKSR